MPKVVPHKKGFTLIEMMAVVVVLGVIVSIGLVQFNKTMEIRTARNARMNLIDLHQRLHLYMIEKNWKLSVNVTPCAPYGGNWDAVSFRDCLNMPNFYDDRKFNYWGATYAYFADRWIGGVRKYELILQLDYPVGPNNPYCVSGINACPIGPVVTGSLPFDFRPPALQPGDTGQY